MGIYRSLLVAALLAVLSGCSPYGYSKEITTFSENVDKLSASFAAGYDAPTDDRSAALRIQLIDGRLPVNMTASCGVRIGSSPDSKPPCTLVRATRASPRPVEIPSTPTENELALAGVRDETMDALKVLKDYVKALAAVTNAADRAAYDAAVGQLSSSVTTLAAAASVAAPAAALAPAAVNLFGWVVGTALDQQRYDTLRAAVLIVDTPMPYPDGTPAVPTPGPKTDAEKKSELQRLEKRKPIHVIATRFGNGLLTLSVARQQWLYQQGQNLTYRLGPQLSEAAYKQRLSDAQAVVGTINALRKSDPTGAANDIAEAHDALAEAIRNPKNGYAELLTALSTFGEKVAAVQAAMPAVAQPPADKKGS